MPLWPQLRDILAAYLSVRTTAMVLQDAPSTSLLFPSFRTGKENRLVELRKILDRVSVRGGWKAGDVRSRALRHTYRASRLQTLDGGAPVSLFTVAREMGHGGDSLVRRIYAHLGEVRHRAQAVEYWPEQHASVLGERSRCSIKGLRKSPLTCEGS
jgi:integrase